MLAETNSAIDPNDPLFLWLPALARESPSLSLSLAFSLSDRPLEEPCPSEHMLPISSKGGKYETESVAGRRDGETVETAGEPVLADGRDGRERRDECRERGAEMGRGEPAGRGGMAEREEAWRCAGLKGCRGEVMAGGGGRGEFYLLFVL